MRNNFDDEEDVALPFARELGVSLGSFPTDSLTIFSSYQTDIVINMDPKTYHRPERDASMLLAFIYNHLPRETWEAFVTDLYTRYVLPKILAAQAEAAQPATQPKHQSISQASINELKAKVSKLKKTKEVKEDTE